jgi:hypothetical protein
VKTLSHAIITVSVSAMMLASCGEREPSEVSLPERTALRLFATTQGDQPSEDFLSALFGSGLSDRQRTALLEALSELPAPLAVEAVRSEELEELARIVVDIRADLPAGGMAIYSVQLEQASQGDWTILWFQGPGVEWPRREPPRRGEGLSTSALPTGPGPR